jgi:aspartate racemase
MTSRGEVLGVLGGMGPLASAEFVRNIYRFGHPDREQDMPRVLLDSDAAVPDRTAAIRSGRHAEITALLEERLRGLLELGATRIVIACFTAHAFLPAVDPAVRAHVRSIVDITLDELGHREGRFLMLCTEGTTQSRIFQNAPGWPMVADRVVYPSTDDQAKVHRLIYQMKIHGSQPAVLRTMDELRHRYGCTGVIGGCTEFHLVSAELIAKHGRESVIDALHTIAVDPERIAAVALTS